MNLKLKIGVALFSVFISSIPSIQAQNRRGTGLLTNDPRYRHLPALPSNIGLKANNMQLTYSLRNYCPTPGNQGATSACAGWAAGFGALSIARAIQGNVTDRTAIDKIAHSAYYLYNKIKLGDDCKSGALLSEAMTQMKSGGVCRANRFQNVPANCAVPPPQDAVEDAQNYRIKDFCRVFSEQDAAEAKIMKLRQLIQQKNPIVIGMQVLESFYNVPSGQKIWKPAANEPKLEAHAMVLIGYDQINRTFELMNSWGTGWGDGGFIHIGYEDMINNLLFGYMMVLEDRPNADHVVKSTGAFAFRTPAGYRTENGQNVPNFEKTGVQLNAQRGVYETTQQDWKAGNTVFQLTTTNVPQGKYVYVFSCDPSAKIEIHYPLNLADSANLVPSAAAEIVIPSADQAMLLTEKGTDNLCILYSDQPIKDFNARLDKIKNGNNPFQDKLKAAFGDLLANPAAIKYHPTDMRFEATFKTGEANLVPMVLTVNAL